MKDSFSRLHPVVCFFFYISVILFSMLENNPFCLSISLVCAFVNAVALNGKKTIVFTVKYLIPTMLMVIIINPLFNHSGVTILAYLPWGNPLTLESVLYGFFAAALLCTVVLWFSSFNKVMTTDKLVYLFGRLSPSLSLLFSMSLRLVPKLSAQTKEVKESQKALGRDISRGSVFQRLKTAAKIISVMISRMLEDSLETADSMKSRGYGLKGRTAFSLYTFRERDFAVLSAVVIMSLSLIGLKLCHAVDFKFFPMVKGGAFTAETAACYIIYALLMLLPVIINVWEGIKWKRLQSAI